MHAVSDNLHQGHLKWTKSDSVTHKTTYQMWDSSRIGSFDFVKNSFAAEPEQ